MDSNGFMSKIIDIIVPYFDCYSLIALFFIQKVTLESSSLYFLHNMLLKVTIHLKL